MDLEKIDSKLAILLTGICKQTFNLFENADRLFIVPKGYHNLASFTATAFGKKKELFGFILQSDKDIIIAFRGTDSKEDTLADLNASQCTFPWAANKCATHRGFTDIYNTLRQQVIAVLANCSPDKRLIITGHSLGGALATLCALDIASNTHFGSPTVYTFGAPRVGDPIFAANYNRLMTNNYRVVINSDLVPLLPPPIYKTVKTRKIYLYLHVNGAYRLHFHGHSFSQNHALFNYFRMLSKLDPSFAETLCDTNASFCPFK
jgi:triacylglycerol lipase